MNPLCVIMGLADITSIALILYSYGLTWFVWPLMVIMIIKGAMSFT